MRGEIVGEEGRLAPEKSKEDAAEKAEKEFSEVVVVLLGGLKNTIKSESNDSTLE